jgi:hypothetical protein
MLILFSKMIMRNLFLFSPLLALLLIAFKDDPCSILKKGKFKYLDGDDTSSYFEVNGDKHIEYYQNGKYYIKSKLEWLGNCVYQLTMTEKTLPDFPYTSGDKLKVEVLNIKNDTIYYTASVKGNVWQGRVLLMK